MSKLLIELGLEESIEDWLKEMRWKRNNDYMAFENAIEECRALARQEVGAERERCAKICESSAERYEGLAIAARESRGPLSNSEANEYSWAAECARQQAKMIRGEK